MSKNETKSTVLLKHHLKALKLPTMLAEAEKIASDAQPIMPTISRSFFSSLSWN